MNKTSPDFAGLTELPGDLVSVEQVERIARRYHWAGPYCTGKDVLEVACGGGQGLSYLAAMAKTVTAGDYSEQVLEVARRHMPPNQQLRQFDAHEMPFDDGSFDVVLIFEALYYLADVEGFFKEVRRVLRPGGTFLIATANKDLFDFTPSASSHRYLGVAELGTELSALGFQATFFGDTPVAEVSARQRLLRPVKALVSQLGLMPRSKNAKKFLKRFVFGGLVPMPAHIAESTAARVTATPLPGGQTNVSHKVIFCAATLGA